MTSSMKLPKSRRWLSRSKYIFSDGGVQSAYGSKMKWLPFMTVLCTTMLFILYRTTNYQHRHAKIEATLNPFDTIMERQEATLEEAQVATPQEPLVATLEEPHEATLEVKSLPRGIMHASSDLELRPLWLTNSLNSKVDAPTHRNLLAISVGIKQKQNVDAIVQKFFSENFTVILFHYDCNVDGWREFEWSNEVIHIVAHNQTKWWFAKRFLHPDIVSIYDYIFIWDEDLGVQNFHPGRYLKIMKSEGLEISQPALDPNSSEIHHRITIRKKTKKLHRRIYERRGSVKCSDASEGPPCTGYVEGMAPVFSRSAWRCAWNLIQNDLVHGWGMDMKLGYCSQGDRTKKVGIIDREFVVHQGVQTLGGSFGRKVSRDHSHEESTQRRGAAVDVRSEIRRQSTSELQIFRKRWEEAAREDKDWVDPFPKSLT